MKLGEAWSHSMEDISGWAESLETALLTILDFEDKLDTYIAEAEQFSCPDCGWWIYPGESIGHTNDNDEQVCSDCGEEYE